MKIFKFVLLVLILITVTPVLSQSKLRGNYDKTLTLFTKFNNELEKTQQVEIKEGKFISPIDSAVNFLEVLRKEAPDLYDHTNCYSESLLAILVDKDFSRNENYYLNIIRILYHLKIDEYIKVLSEIYHDYKLSKVNSKIFLESIFTFYGYYSNLIVLNYNNPKLNQFLDKISSDSQIVRKVKKIEPDFLQGINYIKNGALFKEFQTTQKGWFFVYDIPEAKLNQ